MADAMKGITVHGAKPVRWMAHDTYYYRRFWPRKFLKKLLRHRGVLPTAILRDLLIVVMVVYCFLCRSTAGPSAFKAAGQGIFLIWKKTTGTLVGLTMKILSENFSQQVRAG